MFVARWQIDARFGHKQEVVDLMRGWENEVGRAVGMGENGAELLSGSIGAREATLENNLRFASLAELDTFFANLANNQTHSEWGKRMEPHVVSGTSYWTIFRTL